MRFPFLTIFIIFLLWLAYKIRKAKSSQAEKNDAFWQKEMTANATPAKDISNLSYITIPIDKFPLHFSDDPEVISIENEITELSTHRLLNLTGKSNADLKLEYGVPNFDTMSKIGEDYDRLTVLLNSYASALIEAGRITDAISVLEFAIGTKTDVGDSYVKLAHCYQQTQNNVKLDYLTTQVEKSDLLLKKNILEQISNL